MDVFLKVNGFDEDCDSMGGEDYAFGLMAERQGHEVWYYPKCRTWESEEGHHTEEDKKTRVIKKFGPAPKDDYSHTYLNFILDHGRNRAPNYFPFEGLAGLRDHILNGEKFPTDVNPQHDWRDGQPLSEM